MGESRTIRACGVWAKNTEANMAKAATNVTSLNLCVFCVFLHKRGLEHGVEKAIPYLQRRSSRPFRPASYRSWLEGRHRPPPTVVENSDHGTLSSNRGETLVSCGFNSNSSSGNTSDVLRQSGLAHETQCSPSFDKTPKPGKLKVSNSANLQPLFFASPSVASNRCRPNPLRRMFYERKVHELLKLKANWVC